jgi:hypothetical protein
LGSEITPAIPREEYPMATATATRYEGTFHGRAHEVARVRKEIAAYLGKCPVADDLVLIADELASNSILHTC